MSVWVVLGQSCRDCGAIGIKVLSHKPTKEELATFDMVLGGMWCITNSIFQAEIDGDVVETFMEEGE